MHSTRRIHSNVVITVCAILGFIAMAGVGAAQGDREACDQAITACIDGGGDIDRCEREHILCRSGWTSPVNPLTVEHVACEALNTICQELAATDPEAFAAESCQTNFGLCTCPENARFAPNGEGDGFCLFENLEAPEGAQPHCDYLTSHDTVGYHFEGALADATCPEGARQTSNSEGLNYCVFENLQVPEDARPHCAYLTSHDSIGYYFSLD